MKCSKPPKGWHCIRSDAPHTGPCAAVPDKNLLEKWLCGCPYGTRLGGPFHEGYCPYAILVTNWKRSLVVFVAAFYAGYLYASLNLPWK